MTDANNYESVW